MSLAFDDYIADHRDDFKNEFRDEIKNEVRDEILAENKEKIRAEVEKEAKEEAIKEIRYKVNNILDSLLASGVNIPDDLLCSLREDTPTYNEE